MKCSSCLKWKFFEKKVDGICSSCYDLKKDSEYYFLMEERKKEKAERRVAREKKLNEKLKEELKEKPVKKIVKEKVVIKDEVVAVKQKVKKVSLLQEAEKLSTSFDSVLYVYADVKRVRVIEWVNGKKRVALNKSREIRHTHKGGFSQEKFQKFVDNKKKNWLQWVEDNLKRGGVLRGPYEKVICDGVEEEWVRSFLY